MKYEISIFLIHNRAVFGTAAGTATVTERFHGRMDFKIFLMFIVAENTGSVNITVTVTQGWKLTVVHSPEVIEFTIGWKVFPYEKSLFGKLS